MHVIDKYFDFISIFDSTSLDLQVMPFLLFRLLGTAQHHVRFY